MKRANLIKWEGDNEYEVLEFCNRKAIPDLDIIWVKTKSGLTQCDLGDYIRKNEDGTFDVLEPDLVESECN